MGFGYNGNDGVLRGNICREGCEIGGGSLE